MKPGDLVECVNIAPLPECRNCNLHKLTRGQVYTVKDEATYFNPYPGVYLAEIRNPIDPMIHMEIGYDQRRLFDERQSRALELWGRQSGKSLGSVATDRGKGSSETSSHVRL